MTNPPPTTPPIKYDTPTSKPYAWNSVHLSDASIRCNLGGYYISMQRLLFQHFIIKSQMYNTNNLYFSKQYTLY